VILFVGDGLGTGHIAAARAYAGRPLSFEGWAVTTRVATHSANSLVTDSAAAGTALATGRKVANGVVSLALPGDGAAPETLLEQARRQGKKTGLVTTSYLTDATPAAFGAHAATRFDFAAIASNYLENTRPDVLLGGGGYGLAATSCVMAGYTVVTSRDKLLNFGGGVDTRLAGLFGEAPLPFEWDGTGGLPHLSEMTRMALRVLDANPDGFFLMVESGSSITQVTSTIFPTVGEMLELENAVNEAVTWARRIRTR